MSGNKTVIALNRFGFGAGPEDLLPGSPAVTDPETWLLSQLEPVTKIPESLRSFSGSSATLREFRRMKKYSKRKPSEFMEHKKSLKKSLEERKPGPCDECCSYFNAFSGAADMVSFQCLDDIRRAKTVYRICRFF